MVKSIIITKKFTELNKILDDLKNIEVNIEDNLCLANKVLRDVVKETNATSMRSRLESVYMISHWLIGNS